MFRFFENLIDPYAHLPTVDAPPRRLWPFLWHYLHPFRRLFLIASVVAVVVALVEVGLISYMGRLVNVLTDTPPEQAWDTHGTEFILAAVFLLTVRPALQALDAVLLNQTLLPNVGTVVRYRAHAQVLRQSVGWFENDFAGRIANRIMQTPPAVGEAVFQVFDAIAFSLAYVLGALFLLGQADMRLAIPLVIWLGMYGGLVYWTITRVGPASKAASDARSAVTGRVVDSYSNIHSVKMFAQNDQEMDYAKSAIEVARQTFAREMRLFTIMDVVLVTINGFLIVGVVGWAIALWMQGAANLGVVAAATALVLRLNSMTGWIMWALSSFFRNLGIIAEGMETIADPITLTDRPDARPLSVQGGAISFEGVSHHYGRTAGGLDRLSLDIKPGEKVGLVGQSGVGKSTLVKLLLRFYEVEQGRILIDGTDIREATQDSVRRAIGMVGQDSSLMHRSVRENIAYGRPDATDDQIIAAAKQAEAHEFILALEDPQGRRGYDAHVGERGVKLSGGQRQRITLARVILKDAPILVLDEATSALDSEVEAEIQKTLYDVMDGKTVIAIAHRLSTIAHMDRIVVLDAGKIAEIGSHDALLAQEGLYSRYWARQSGGFIGTDT